MVETAAIDTPGGKRNLMVETLQPFERNPAVSGWNIFR
jgi:hypothetical protein